MKMTDDYRCVVGLVVPTLGLRPGFLVESVQSIRSGRLNGRVFVVLVAPADVEVGRRVDEAIDLRVLDPGRGLAHAINTGIAAMPVEVEYVSWLGDDDRLVPGSVDLVVNELERTGAAAVYGQCRYIDNSGDEIWLNRSGRWASSLMLFGPQLVPQPGSLVRRSDFAAIGGLNVNFKWAFDLEMFLQLRRRSGGLRFLPIPLAEFRWHEGSLSVGGRRGSVTEASNIRRRHLKVPLRQLSVLWEPALKRLILWAGVRMNRRLSTRH